MIKDLNTNFGETNDKSRTYNQENINDFQKGLIITESLHLGLIVYN